MSDYDFHDMLDYSNSDTNTKLALTILEKLSKDSAVIAKSPPVLDRKGSDFYIINNSGKLSHIDVKFRPKDFMHVNQDGITVNDDIVIEYDTPNGPNTGWTVDSNKITDYVLWIWPKTNRYKLVDAVKLRAAALGNTAQWNSDKYIIGQNNYTKGFGLTPAVCVPCSKIPDFDTFSWDGQL